jgi:hypothetical protein
MATLSILYIYTSTIRWQCTAIMAYIALAMYKPATGAVCQQGSLMTCMGGRKLIFI